MLKELQAHRLILASASPRRKMLFESLGVPFTVRTHVVDESFPTTLHGGEIAEYLAGKKADAFAGELKEKDIVITADTVVWINGHALNKPADREEAAAMLKEISGDVHSVFTGVCIKTGRGMHCFSEETRVHFNTLSDADIHHYLDTCKPYDKAGAYGIQEFIGLIGIRKVEGDFYNVVGFPVQRFWRELNAFLPAEENR